jgi:signal peptidase I
MRRRRAIVLAWVLTALVVLALVVKSFVADVYRVDSGSMRPTLFGGRDRPDGREDAEHVLVLYRRDLEPRRFDLVVMRSPDGSKPLVKRVCGVPHDRNLVIRDGDLFVDGKRLPPEVPRPAPVPVYDDRWQDPERFFEHRRDGSVRREGGEWVVDGGPVPPGSLLHYHPALRDDYLDRQHRRVPGVIEVNDAVLELEFLLEGPLEAQKLHFELVEAGDTFQVVLAAGPDGARLRLERSRPRVSPELLAEVPIALAEGRWHHLSFSNVDNHLRVRSPELRLDLGRSYAENEPWPRAGAERPVADAVVLPAGQRSIGPRVRFGVEGGRARFRSVRILRDLYYTDDGRFGTCSGQTGPGGEAGPASPVSLGPDDYFLLGDNSAASTDSRHFGRVQGADLIGRPLAVVWPEPRWLSPPQE